MSTILIAQIVGCFAVLISLSIFQLNKRTLMLRVAMTAAVFYAIHFFLLGAFTGAALSLVGAARCYVFSRSDFGPYNNQTLALFLLITSLATITTWQGPISLLAATGSAIGTFAYWHKSAKAIRKWSLTAPPIWFTYNAISGSYPGMFIEVVMFLSNLIGERRFDIKHTSHVRRKVARPA